MHKKQKTMNYNLTCIRYKPLVQPRPPNRYKLLKHIVQTIHALILSITATDHDVKEKVDNCRLPFLIKKKKTFYIYE